MDFVYLWRPMRRLGILSSWNCRNVLKWIPVASAGTVWIHCREELVKIRTPTLFVRKFFPHQEHFWCVKCVANANTRLNGENCASQSHQWRKFFQWLRSSQDNGDLCCHRMNNSSSSEDVKLKLTHRFVCAGLLFWGKKGFSDWDVLTDAE